MVLTWIGRIATFVVVCFFVGPSSAHCLIAGAMLATVLYGWDKLSASVQPTVNTPIPSDVRAAPPPVAVSAVQPSRPDSHVWILREVPGRCGTEA